ncbi:Cytochrome c, class III, conserved region [Desulfovibrio sp. X2]|uniref:cytochrome c3 family protein n=1 Tax=Desulfovibrio sp. X2 TaxID=941449 RepID=UPI000358DF49|nr:cytochrome c3 family protein [Desulfovibrio sp. X2]EPR41967.1 Cytochrome c, class III, conserved region [Desulfovibrio sp. X2]
MRAAHIVIAALAAALLCAFALPGFAQPDSVTIGNPADFPGGLKRGPVKFNHDAHVSLGLDCTACHHRYENGTNVLDPSELLDGTTPGTCDSCHGGDKPAGGLGLQAAFHKECIGCHAGHGPDPKIKGGPRACAGCHETK